MRKLLCILMLILTNLPLLGSEQNIEYTENTCNRTYHRSQFDTDEERERYSECSFSRWEVYDNSVKKYIAHVAYNPNNCYIEYLRVDEKYKKQGIGTALAWKAIEDMRANHNCGEISLDSAWDARTFWRKLGAEPSGGDRHVFRNDSSK